jgi:hypothetical protein
MKTIKKTTKIKAYKKGGKCAKNGGKMMKKGGKCPMMKSGGKKRKDAPFTK